MSRLSSSLHRATLALLGMLMAAAVLVTQSAAASAAGAPSAVRQATGYSAAQLRARPACGAEQAGQIRCLAQVLTVKGSGRTAPLLHIPHLRSAAGAASASAAPGQFTAPYLQWAYDTAWLSANNGASDTVAIVDAYGDSTAYSDMEQFRSANGLPSQPLCGGSVTTSCFEVVNQSGHSSPLPTAANDETGSWNIEESLDIDAVSSICPLCKILVVEANSDDSDNLPDLETGVASAAGLGANQISLSWGTDTTPNATANSSPYSSITSAAILAAAGDASYPGPAVGYPAALANVTAVGGTALAPSSSAARGFSETAWSKQICTNGATCGTESGCDPTQSRPTFQTGVTTSCTGRAYNDISADGDPNTGLNIYDSQPGSEGCGTANNWCIVGGTSLATPLVAAFEAVTGISGRTPAWTYAKASLLNDIVSGSNATCPSGEYLICNAGTGWDGPTGNGSISGDLASGPPGIGGDVATGVNARDVTLAGGVYSNGAATSSYWAYWVNGNTGTTKDTTLSTTSGTGAQPVSDTLCGSLTPSTTYDYELVATNASGTAIGYQGSFKTPATESAPTASGAPAIGGSPQQGQTLTAQDASWNDQSCNSSPTYQWQESTSPSGPWTTVGSSLTYTLTSADVGKYLQFVATESNASGSTPYPSNAIGPVTAPISPTPTTPTTSTTPPPTATAPTTTSTITVVRFYRCARACVLINTHGATIYRPQRADWGRFIKVVTTTTRTTNNISAASVTTRWVGPISSPRAGSLSVSGSAHVASVLGVRASTHKLLAQVRILRHARGAVTLAIKRQGRTPTRVWAYVVRKGAVVSCTAVHAVRASFDLKVALKAGQTLKLVAVQT